MSDPRPDSPYRHDLSTAERQKASYRIDLELMEEVRDYTRPIARLRVNQFILDAIERQVLSWFDQEMIGTDPLTGNTYLKPKGQHFPRKPSEHDFDRGGQYERERGKDTPKTTVRGDPELLEDWWAGVWALPDLSYPSYALEDAIREHLKALRG